MFIAMQRTVLFGPARGVGPRQITDRIIFPGPVKNLFVGLSGYSTSFDGNTAGRPFGRLIIRLGNTAITGNEVDVPCSFGLRDWTGEWDDTYSAVINYSAFAELEENTEFDERLTINGVEFNQAIQFFRAKNHLDFNTVQPDNAIPLVAGKATAVGVYADYDSPNAETAFEQYEGDLLVDAGGQVTTIELDSDDARPRRDLVEAPLTLNEVPRFIIPRELCEGSIKISGRLRVVDQNGGEDSGFSPLFERTLSFMPNEAIDVFVVGFALNGNDAPTESEARAFFNMAANMLPVRRINFTGFQEVPIETDGTLAASTVHDRLLRLRSDAADEIIMGIFSAEEGVFPVQGISADVSGSATGPGGVAFVLGFFGQDTVAHELGHLLGLGHVDTGSEETPHEPYPRYGSYGVGSIGSYGIDTESNTVKLPGAPRPSFDFMSYRDPAWISPFIYSRFLPATSEVSKVVSPNSRDAKSGETLFLNLKIHRSRRVARKPSFHFPAEQRATPQPSTDFFVELADECQNPIVCWPLETTSHTAFYCWPKSMYARMPFPNNAKWLFVYENDELLYQECISPAPGLDLECRQTSVGIDLSWSSSPAEDVTFLVQYRDQSGRWRGQQHDADATQISIPFSRASTARVLASSGIATTLVQCNIATRLLSPGFTLSATEIRATGSSNSTGPRLVGLRAELSDGTGQSVRSASFEWFDSGGRLIERGAVLRFPHSFRSDTEIALVVNGIPRGTNRLMKRWALDRMRDDWSIREIDIEQHADNSNYL